MSFYGLAGSLHDGVALAGSFGPGAVLGFGAAHAASCDILVPAGTVLDRAEVDAAAALGRAGYFLSFGNDGLAQDRLEQIAGAIEHLAAASGVGFMPVCLAAPAQGRTVYQGHLFQGGSWQGDLARAFGSVMDGGVGIVPREVATGGAAAIRAQCGRLKEQGKVLALIDAIDDDDCANAAEAMAGMALVGGAAGFAGAGGGFADDLAAGQVAILSGALDRQTIFQLGAARASLPVFDLNFSMADPVRAALGWAAAQNAGAFIITSSVPPDRQVAGAPAAAVLGEIANGLAAAGVRRFIVAGGETGGRVRAALGITVLRAASKTGALLWLKHESLAISFKAPGIGAKNLFLSEFEPHLRLNDIAELAS